MIYIYIYIYIFFFNGLPVGGTNEKKKRVKKKKGAGRLAGLLPIFCFESRYSGLYRDTGRTGARMARQDTTTTQLSMPAVRRAEGYDTAYDTVGQHAGRAAARVRMAWGELRYKNCIVARVNLLGRNIARDTTYDTAAYALRHGAQCARQGPRCHNTILYRDKGAVTRRCDTHDNECVTRRAARVGSQYSFYIVIGGGLRHDNVSARHGLRHGQCALQHACDKAPRRHDTALYGPRHDTQRAACARPRRSVCAVCTRPSFDLVHYSESLFMDTVYEHCSRGF